MGNNNLSFTTSSHEGVIMAHSDDPTTSPAAAPVTVTPVVPSQNRDHLATDIPAGGAVPQDILEEACRRCKSTVVMDMAKETTLTQMIGAYHRYVDKSERTFTRMYKRWSAPVREIPSPSNATPP